MKYFSVCLLFLLVFKVCATPTPLVTLTNDINQLNITDKLEIYTNPNQHLAFEDISKPEFAENFKAIGDIPNLYDFDNNQYWVRVTIKNESDFETFLITLDQWDLVEIYSRNQVGEIQYQKDGNLLTFKEKPHDFGRLAHLKLHLPQGEENVFYFKFSSTTQFDAGLKQLFNYFKRFNIDTYSNAQRNHNYAVYFFCIYIGLIAVITVYKTSIYFFTKDKSYLFFALYSFCMLFYIIAESGLGHQFLYPNNPVHSKELFFFLLLMSFFFFTFFVQYYLQLQKISPKLYLFYYILGLSYLILFIIVYFTNSALFGLIFLLNIVHNFTNLYANILSILRGFKPALYFLAGNVILILALIYSIVLSVGIFNYNFPVINLPLHMANIFQIIVLAIGLANRMNILRKEAEKQKEENRILIENKKQTLEEEVKKQTLHIQEQTEELQVQNEELQQTTEEVLAQRDAIAEKNRLLEFKERQINQSIRSAELIQQAILPYHEKLEQIFQEFFIINCPKDVVSGDFYWLDKIGNKTILVVADCTGHGVPGAFMTLIGANLLDKIVIAEEITHPDLILTLLHKEVQYFLKQKYSLNNNGMDAVVITLERESHQFKLNFSGAKNNILVWTNNKLVELKGTRKSIGGIQNENIQFESQSLKLNAGDLIYLGSDGLEDQNNVKRKKFGRNKIKEIIATNKDLTLSEQQQVFEKTLEEHMKNTDQRDDILWMGVKI